MTQDQIDQLIAFASAEIDRHMAGLTIQGGNGVTVDGYAADQVVSVQVPHTEPENPPPPPELTTTLWITITGTEVRNIQGETETIVIDSGRQSVANLTRKSSAWFADWDAWIIDASGELGTQKRSVVFTLQLEPFRFPMSLTFQYLDNFYNVRAQEEVRITGGGVTRYVPTIPGHFPDVDNSFTIWIPRIARLGSSGPIASLVQVPGPP